MTKLHNQPIDFFESWASKQTDLHVYQRTAKSIARQGWDAAMAAAFREIAELRKENAALETLRIKVAREDNKTIIDLIEENKSLKKVPKREIVGHPVEPDKYLFQEAIDMIEKKSATTKIEDQEGK